MVDEQGGLFGDPPLKILCWHDDCHKEISWTSSGDYGERKWVHVDSHQSQCYPDGRHWAKPSADQKCPDCSKTMPREWCWEGKRDCPLGMPLRYPGPPTAQPRVSIPGPRVTPLPEPLEAHARTTDPITSHEAAASIGSDKLRRSQLAVLSMFQRFGPMHDHDLVDRYTASSSSSLIDQSTSGIRTRRKELVRSGVLEDSGEKGILPSGRRAIIWRIWKP